MFWHCAAHVKHGLSHLQGNSYLSRRCSDRIQQHPLQGGAAVRSLSRNSCLTHSYAAAMLLTGVRRLSKPVLMCQPRKQGNQEAADAVYSGIQPLTAGEHHNG